MIEVSVTRICEMLSCLNDEACEANWDDAYGAIHDTEVFGEADARCAKEVLAKLTPWSNAGDSALLIVKRFFGTPDSVEDGLVSVLNSPCRQKLKLVCRHAAELPSSLSPTFCRALLAASRASDCESVDFVSELMTLRPLLRKCRRVLQDR